jgi:dihydroflavonol-4-reductase
MRILLTGASGFIGLHVAAELAGAGGELVGFCRSEPVPDTPLCEWIAGDVRDPAALRRAIRGCAAVVHTAARYSYDRAEAPAMHAVNVLGTRNVVQAASAAGVRRLLVTSSSATCGPVPGRPATEHDRPPSWELAVPYKRTKLLAERLALEASSDQLEVVAVNPTTVVGPGDRKPTPSGKMIRDLVESRIIGYMHGAGINVVGVRDVARGHRLALDRGRAGERYILGGENVWLRDAFGLVASAVGRQPPWLPVPWPALYVAALAADRAGRLIGRPPRLLVLDEVRLARRPLFFSSEKARRELGYAPGPAAVALGSAAAWFAGSYPPPADPAPARHAVRAPGVRRPAGHW